MNKLSSSLLGSLTARNSFCLTQHEQEHMLTDMTEVLEQIDILKLIDANGVEANTSTPCLVSGSCNMQAAEQDARGKEDA